EGVLPCVVFAGWLEGRELVAAYHASDVVLMPSVCFDTFGMVCLEAMACQKPVIATCFGGPKEVVVDGETGYIVNPFDVAVFAERIVEMLSDSDKAQHFGEAGHKRAQELFNLEHIMTLLIEKYQIYY